jgi:hypothetical protein
MFQHNLGFADIGVRYMIMMVFMILAGALQMMVFMVVGVIFFLTAILGWCPIYNMLGISTRKE